jgi:hypothetical protein
MESGDRTFDLWPHIYTDDTTLPLQNHEGQAIDLPDLRLGQRAQQIDRNVNAG